MVRCLPAIRETRVRSWVGKISWRRKWQSTPVLLPGKSHGQRSLVGYSLWGCKESDTTERLHFLGTENTSAKVFIIFNLLLPTFLKQDLASSLPCYMGFPGGSDSKASVYNVGDLGSIPGLGRTAGEGNGNPLQYYCLENPMDRGAW